MNGEVHVGFWCLQYCHLVSAQHAMCLPSYYAPWFAIGEALILELLYALMMACVQRYNMCIFTTVNPEIFGVKYFRIPPKIRKLKTRNSLFEIISVFNFRTNDRIQKFFY